MGKTQTVAPKPAAPTSAPAKPASTAKSPPASNADAIATLKANPTPSTTSELLDPVEAAKYPLPTGDKAKPPGPDPRYALPAQTSKPAAPAADPRYPVPAGVQKAPPKPKSEDEERAEYYRFGNRDKGSGSMSVWVERDEKGQKKLDQNGGLVLGRADHSRCDPNWEPKVWAEMQYMSALVNIVMFERKLFGASYDPLVDLAHQTVRTPEEAATADALAERAHTQGKIALTNIDASLAILDARHAVELATEDLVKNARGKFMGGREEVVTALGLIEPLRSIASAPATAAR